jgi:hypothetical protein
MNIKDGHTDVASAKRQCTNIIEDCQDILPALPEDSEASLPTWWTNKLAVSAAYINSDRDYLVYTVQETPNEESTAPKSPTEMLVTMGEEDAFEKGEESKDDIEKHQGADEETFTFTFEGDNNLSQESGDIEKRSSAETSSSDSSEISRETSS